MQLNQDKTEDLVIGAKAKREKHLSKLYAGEEPGPHLVELTTCFLVFPRKHLTPSAPTELSCLCVDGDQKAGSHYISFKRTALSPHVF